MSNWNDVMYSYLIFQQRVRLGNRIRLLRELRGMTQFDLYVKTGILTHSISDIENGKHNAGIDSLIKIAVALDCSLDFIINN
jgi:transcriptional regulator with XRE-family HTH domain